MNIDFENITMSEIVGLINDPNKCPGGKNSVRRVLQETLLPSKSIIVEIGSNTGFTSIELALRRPDCSVIGIDINVDSVNYANEKARKFNIKNVQFFKDNATEITTITPKSVDLLFVSNVMSFIEDKDKAFENYDKVLKDGGIVCFIPIYYYSQPPQNLVNTVEKLIAGNLTKNTLNDWLTLFQKKMKEYALFFQEDYKFVDISENKIKSYVDDVFGQCKTLALNDEDERRLNKRFYKMLLTFNENLKFCQFSILLYRKTLANTEPQLNEYIKLI